jgi:hypothetical protein
MMSLRPYFSAQIAPERQKRQPDDESHRRERAGPRRNLFRRDAQGIEVDRREGVEVTERLRFDNSGANEEEEQHAPVVTMAGRGLHDVRRSCRSCR